MARNARAKTKSRPRFRFLPEALLIVGIVLVTVSGIHNVLRLRSLTLDQATVQKYLAAAPAPVGPDTTPTHIFIKWYVDVDIDKNVYTNGAWTVSPDHASYLVASARPGEAGNIIIYGHNLRTIMGNIRALQGGETITLTLADGATRDYKIISTQEVAPTETALLEPTTLETLTLYTCSGLLDSRRFVVRAIPK